MQTNRISMNPIFIPLILSLIFGLISVYCFLLQRTARKIRQYGYGTIQNNTEWKLLPNWFSLLVFLGFLRFPSLIWLFTLNRKLALVLFVVFWLLKIFFPVNDFKNVQIIKKNVKTKLQRGEMEYYPLYDLVQEVEKKTI